ncbi:MAG: hypothetical protein H0T89_18260 [Deltaproteobacteria bacterium]|nr:hypothetical protein [Deltaproteobacteria bacterium]
MAMAIGSVACKKSSQEPVMNRTGSAPSAPAGHPRLPATATPDQIVAGAFANQTVSTVLLQYVAADGTLDRANGKLMIRTIFPTDQRGPEAGRKLGGPIVWNGARMYAGFEHWDGAGTWKRDSGYGDDQLVALRPACTIKQLWQRAIAAGAPAGALSQIELNAGAAGRAQHWLFTITDAPRKVFFRLEIPDDCAVMVEATP